MGVVQFVYCFAKYSLFKSRHSNVLIIKVLFLITFIHSQC